MGKQKPELPQGTLDMLVLKALSLGQMHGYGVGQRIGQLAEDMLKVEEGTLYPALYRMSNAGGSKASGEYRRTTGGRATTN
jgi:DNA-binding PadR family transcriptional regulator